MHRHGAYVRLGETQFGQRGLDSSLFGRATPGSPVTEIIVNRAVHDGPRAFSLGHDAELAVELALAVVAAVGGIGSEVRVGELAGGHHFDAGAEAGRLIERELELARRVG